MIWFSFVKDSALTLSRSGLLLPVVVPPVPSSSFRSGGPPATRASRMGPGRWLGLRGARSASPSPAPPSVLVFDGVGGSTVGCCAALPHVLEGACTDAEAASPCAAEAGPVVSTGRLRTCCTMSDLGASCARPAEDDVPRICIAPVDRSPSVAPAFRRTSLTETLPWRSPPSSSSSAEALLGSLECDRLTASMVKRSSISRGMASLRLASTTPSRPSCSRNLWRSSTRSVQSYV
mmetsp:Transcript_20409/g.57433  ORF Transcript_20409/g.57433 Transcript_20409/m.57433 type:complete len:234 (+) Transcript_20409:326-1027(+)